MWIIVCNSSHAKQQHALSSEKLRSSQRWRTQLTGLLSPAPFINFVLSFYELSVLTSCGLDVFVFEHQFVVHERRDFSAFVIIHHDAEKGSLGPPRWAACKTACSPCLFLTWGLQFAEWRFWLWPPTWRWAGFDNPGSSGEALCVWRACRHRTVRQRYWSSLHLVPPQCPV